MLLTSYGILSYGVNRVTLELGWDFGNFYYSLLPKSLGVNKQKYSAHITVIRCVVEGYPKERLFDGEKVEFSYGPEVFFDQKYYYLNCHSERIGDMRELLGYTRFRFMDGLRCYHIAIGNVKNKI